MSGGFTCLDNQVLDALISAQLTARQYRIALVVVRYTFGYQMESREFALAFLAKLTGLHKPHVSTALAELIERRVLSRFTDGTIGININIEEWK